MKLIRPILSVALLMILQSAGCSEGSNGNGKRADADDSKKYTNPVTLMSLPDPTVIQIDDVFWLYATEDTGNIPIMKSADLVKWEFAGTVFSDKTRPTFVKNGGLWAPDINRIDGRYVLYYSMSTWGGEWECGIGASTADSPSGPFTDHGKLFISSEIDVKNSIDPFYIEEGSKKYLFWGSFRGIWATELSDDGLSVKDFANKTKVAGTAYEGIYILPRNGYYYMFGSTGSCCEGANSTYTTVVGRSGELFGPYVNKAGDRMLDNKHEIVVHGNDFFAGTGHNAEIVTDKEGTDWLLYHAVNKLNQNGRQLMIDAIVWEDGWPSVKNLVPSRGAAAPVF